MQLMFGMWLISSVVKVWFYVCSFWQDGCCLCKTWCPSFLLPDTQLKLLVKISQDSKIWNLQRTSSTFNENEFKLIWASFTYGIIFSLSAYFQCKYKAAGVHWLGVFDSWPVGWLEQGLVHVDFALPRQGWCQVLVVESWSTPWPPALCAVGWAGIRETPVERKGQIVKARKKLRRSKIFSGLWKLLVKIWR